MQELPREVISKAAKGDIDSFKQIYLHTNSFVYSVALRVSGNREDAKEITQDVFIRIYRKLNSFMFQSSFKTWVYRITANTAINTAKKAQRQRKGLLSYDDDIKLKQHVEEKYSPMRNDASSQLLDKLLSGLDLNQRACITLRSIEGLSYRQIAKALSVNINTVRTRIRRARESMMEQLRERGSL
jgi:RNA polymerase sigma-70 factor, ECF subfamily